MKWNEGNEPMNDINEAKWNEMKWLKERTSRLIGMSEIIMSKRNEGMEGMSESLDMKENETDWGDEWKNETNQANEIHEIR